MPMRIKMAARRAWLAGVVIGLCVFACQQQSEKRASVRRGEAADNGTPAAARQSDNSTSGTTIAKPADGAPGSALQPPAPVEFQEETLANGLRVVYAPLRNAPVVHVRVLYHVGSRDERPDRQGFAHMFEHMMFRGSAHVPPEEHMKLVNTVGGITNAFTSFDQTTYVNTVPAEHTEMVLWLESDRMASFKVSEEIYKTERKVVAEEWRMKMNQPYGNIYEEFLKRLFLQHSYRWTPIGNMEHLRQAALNELQEFFNTYYIPNNAVLVVAGDINVDQTKQWVRKYYGWIPKGNDPPRPAPREPEQTEGRRAVVPANVPLPASIVGLRIGPYASDDQYALALLDEILGGGPSSRLFRRLVASENPLCRAAQSMHMPLEDAGFFGAYGMLLAGKNPDEVDKALREELLALADKGVSDEELAKAKVQYRQSLIQNRKTAEQVAEAVGEEWLFANDAARVNREWKKVAALTKEDLKSVAAKYIAPQRFVALQMVPDPTGQLAKQAAQLAQATESAPVTPASRPVQTRVVKFPTEYPTKPPMHDPQTSAKFAKGQSFDVRGTQVVVMTDNRLPVVSVMMALRRGGHSEPAGKEGLAGLTASMLRRGAGGMSYGELNQRLDSRGISIAVADQGDYTQLTATCPTEQLDETFRLARLIVREPNFDENEFKKLKAQSLSGLMDSLARPDTVAERELDAILYGDSPLGRKVTPKSLESVTLRDVKDFYAKVYRPQQAALILAGDVTTEQGRVMAQTLLQGWQADNLIPEPAYNLPPEPEKRRMLLVDNSGGKQSTVRMGNRAFTVASDEKYAGSLANQILSGGIEARVMRYVRAQKGLAYYAHGIFQPGRHAGAFLGQTDTAIESTGDAMRAIFEVFDKMRQEPVTPEELRESKLRVAGSLVMSMQTIEQQADRRLAVFLNNYPIDYYDRYAERVSAVGADRILDVMRKYVHTDKMGIVVVAPADQVKQQLSSIGEVKVIPMPAKGEEREMLKPQ
jgi:zinc protease